MEREQQAPMPMMFPYPMMPPMAITTPQYFLQRIRPLVRYGLREAQQTNLRHAMTEVALIAYLMGMGYDFSTAHRLVESWEINEKFPGEE